MSTRSINFTPDQGAFAEEVVRTGKCHNASELDLLRTQIRVGMDALDRGDFVEIDGADLDAVLDGFADNPSQ